MERFSCAAMPRMKAIDRHGGHVIEGDRVRILELDPDSFPWLDGESLEKIMAFVGEVLEVVDVDENGHAWVCRETIVSEGHLEYDKIALESHEFELESRIS